jgi:iron(III) transport system substrate-binding protein
MDTAPGDRSRRRFLRRLASGVVLAAAGGPAAPLEAATSAEWEQTVAAARKEGRLAINTFTGQGYGRVLKLFTRTYRDIKVDHTNLEAPDFSPRIISERRAGVYTWDVATMPTSTALQVLRPAGVFDPIRPIIVLEARNDASWRDGFDAGFLDRDRRLAYAFTLVRAVGIFINGDRVEAGGVTSMRDLLAPKWKGKIAIADPRVNGSSFWPLTVARLKLGDGVMRQLLVDQAPVLSRDRNQLTEFMVRGRYPIAIGLNVLALHDYQRHGVGTTIRTLRLPELDYQSSGSLVWLINRAPHPNAARVFVNWLLTKDAQSAWARELETNSRFVGVEPGQPQTVVPSGLRLTQIDAEEFLPEIVKTQDLARQLIS